MFELLAALKVMGLAVGFILIVGGFFIIADRGFNYVSRKVNNPVLEMGFIFLAVIVLVTIIMWVSFLIAGVPEGLAF